ncbi:MAG: hypothetical protein P4L65_02235 [Legionella sp.]|nr:hypothetical protein [Legionella sp.]
MKKIIITGISACVLAASLAGCNTLNKAGQTGNAVVGTGVGFVGAVGTTAVRGVGAVGHGVGTVGYTAARGVGAVGYTAVRGVGAVGSTAVHTVGSGVNYVTGKPATYHNNRMYHKQGVVHRNGHVYRIQNGRYVLVR